MRFGRRSLAGFLGRAARAALLCLAAVGLALALLPAPAAAQPAIEFGRYHALVIGNDGYRALPKLKTAIADARALGELLERRYGFRIQLLLDADRDQIIGAVNRYRAELKDGDNLLIYYAGHGLIDEPTDRGFWLPVDAVPGNESRWLDVNVISANLRAMQARHILVIADSCYAGSLVRADNAAGLTTGGDSAALLARMRERRARLALTSGSLEPVADAGGSGHSVFAGALLRVLRENAGIVSGGELFNRLRARVVASARQTPLYSDIRFAGHEGGDFIFVPRGAAIGAPPPAAADIRAAMELAFWESIKDSQVPADFQAYLDAFPTGQFAPIARRRAERPAKAAAPQQMAIAAVPTSKPADRPAVSDAAGLAALWPEISRALRRQFDASWAVFDRSHYLGTVAGYQVVAFGPDEVALTIDYTVQEISPGGGPGYQRPRQNLVRFRNRAPDYRILQWGSALADPYEEQAATVEPGEAPLSDVAAVAARWDPLREALIRQYDRDFAVADQASGLQAIEAYRIDSVTAGEIVLTLDYRAQTLSQGTQQARLRNAQVVVANRPPVFRVLRWGAIEVAALPTVPPVSLRLTDAADADRFWPILRHSLERQYVAGLRHRPDERMSAAVVGSPAEITIQRYRISELTAEAIVIELGYQVVATDGSRSDRAATARVRNDGPGFAVLDWAR